MPTLPRLWGAAEALVGPATVAAEWQALVGEEWELARPLLRPNGCLAAWYPRPGPAFRPPLRVVQHDSDDWVGVCPETREVIPLSREELVVYGLDLRCLDRVLADGLGFEPVAVPAPLPPGGARLLGEYRPTAGYSFPVHLAVPLESRALTLAACSLASAGTPFLLIAPTRRRLRPDARAVIDAHKSVFLPLSEAVDVSPSGEIALTGFARAELERFRGLNLPAESKTSKFFPTPADATWADLRLRFLDGHRVRAEVKGASQVLPYWDMGMADGRNSGPTKQWEFLRQLSLGYGVFTWSSKAAGRDKQKCREQLAKGLKAFFRIAGEPIELTPDGDGWRTVFRLDPD